MTSYYKALSTKYFDKEATVIVLNNNILTIEEFFLYTVPYFQMRKISKVVSWISGSCFFRAT